MTTKVCSNCTEEKPLECYYKHKGGKQGLRAQCIQCRNAIAKVWVSNNPDKVALARSKAEKKPSVREYRKSYAKINQHYFIARNSFRYHKKASATPLWLTENHKKQIEVLYLQARDCTIVTGEKYEVDHIVPVQGVNVCGLHVPWNLQVLPSDVNRYKSNKVDYELLC